MDAKTALAATPTMRGPLAELDVFMRECYPLVYVTSWEERRFVAMLVERYGAKKPVRFWSFGRGLVDGKTGRCTDECTVGSLTETMRLLEREDAPGIVVFCDLHPWLSQDGSADNLMAIRILRDRYQRIRGNKDLERTWLILSPILTLPPDLEKEVVVLDFPPPDRASLDMHLSVLTDLAVRHRGVKVALSSSDRERLIDAAMGMTLDEADMAFCAALLSDGVLDASDIGRVFAEKRLAIRKSAQLDLIDPGVDMGNVGGLGRMKGWLAKRRRLFSPEARQYGLPSPKGVLLVGVPGCGKSLVAKAIAAQWNLPLLRLDVGRLFAGLIGASEDNMRRALRQAEALAPCVLWIDELEKGFAGMAGGGAGSGDSGTSMRVFGTFLSWMQERKAPVFVVATANQIKALPPELLRRGRFDEVFFVDLPTEPEREQIVAIHLAGRKRDAANFDLQAIARATEGHSGAELEQGLVAAMVEGFDQDREFTTADVLAAADELVPLSRTMQEDIEALRAWARTRAVPAGE